MDKARRLKQKSLSMAKLLAVRGKAGATEFKITDLPDEPRQAQAPLGAQALSDHGEESAEEAA